MSENKIEFTNDTWEYRVVRKESEDGSDEWYSIQEIYFDEDKKPYAYTLDLQVENDTITGMRTQLEKMLEALDDAVLDEGDIVEDNLNTGDWNCELCGESTKNVDYDYIGSGTNHLKCELTLEDENCGTQRLIPKKKSYTYESPDGGKTVYRRQFGEPITWPREKVTKEEWQKDLDENTKSSTIKDRVLKLEMENAELRDRLTELGDEIKERGL